jgi:hypothetical protein
MTGEERLQGGAKVDQWSGKDTKIPPINEGQKISGS